MTVESSSVLNGFPVSVHNSMSLTSPLLPSSTVLPVDENQVGLIFGKDQGESLCHCTCRQPFTDCKTENLDWSDESDNTLNSFTVSGPRKSGSSSENANIKPTSKQLKNCVTRSSSHLTQQRVTDIFRKRKRRIQNRLLKRDDQCQGLTCGIAKQEKMAWLETHPSRVTTQEAFLKLCGLVTNCSAIRLKQEIESHHDMDLECQIVAVEGPKLVRPFLSPNSRSLMSHIKRDIPEQSQSKKQLHFSLDEDRDGVSEDSEIDSENEGVSRRVTPVTLLMIDLSSPLGQRVKKHVKGDLAVQPITDVEHYCTFIPEQSDDVASRLRQRISVPVIHKQRKRGTMTSHCHTLKLNNAERRQFLMTLRTGLSFYSRRLKTQMKNLRVKLKKLTAGDIRLLTMKKKTLINQEITIDDDISIVQVDVPQQLFDRIQKMPVVEDLGATDLCTSVTDGSVHRRSSTGIKRSIPKHLRPCPKSKRKYVLPESDNEELLVLSSSEEEEQHSNEAKNTASAPAGSSQAASVATTPIPHTDSSVCNCLSEISAFSNATTSNGICVPPCQTAGKLNTASARSTSTSEDIHIPNSICDCLCTGLHPISATVGQSQTLQTPLSVSVSGAAASPAAMPASAEMLRVQSSVMPGASGVSGTIMLESSCGQTSAAAQTSTAHIAQSASDCVQSSAGFQAVPALPASALTSAHVSASSSLQDTPHPPTVQNSSSVQSPHVSQAISSVVTTPVSSMQGIPETPSSVVNTHGLEAASPVLLMSPCSMQNAPIVLSSPSMQSAPVLQYIPSVQSAPAVNSPPAMQGAFVLVGPVGGQSAPCMPLYPGVGPVLLNTPLVQNTSMIQSSVHAVPSPAESTNSVPNVQTTPLPGNDAAFVQNNATMQTTPLPGQNTIQSAPVPGQNSTQTAPLPEQNNTQTFPLPVQNNIHMTPIPVQNSTQATAVPGQNNVHMVPIAGQNSVQMTPLAVQNSIQTAPLAAQNSIQTAPLAVQNSIQTAPLAVQNSIQTAPLAVQNSIQTAPLPGQNSIQTAPLLGQNSIQTAPLLGQNSIQTAPLLGQNSIQTAPLPVQNSIQTAPLPGQSTVLAQSTAGIIQTAYSVQNTAALQSNASMQTTPLPAQNSTHAASLPGQSSVFTQNTTSAQNTAVLQNINMQTPPLQGQNNILTAPLSGINSAQTLSLQGQSSAFAQNTSVIQTTPLSMQSAAVLQNTASMQTAPLPGLNSAQTASLPGQNTFPPQNTPSTQTAPYSVNAPFVQSTTCISNMQTAPLPGQNSLQTVSVLGQSAVPTSAIQTMPYSEQNTASASIQTAPVLGQNRIQMVSPCSVQNSPDLQNTASLQTAAFPGQNSTHTSLLGQSTFPAQNTTGVQITPYSVQNNAVLQTSSMQTAALPVQNSSFVQTTPGIQNTTGLHTQAEQNSGVVQSHVRVQTTSLPWSNTTVTQNAVSTQNVPYCGQNSVPVLNSVSMQATSLPVQNPPVAHNTTGIQTTPYSVQNTAVVQSTSVQTAPLPRQNSPFAQNTAGMQTPHLQNTSSVQNTASAQTAPLPRPDSAHVLNTIGVQTTHLQNPPSMQSVPSAQAVSLTQSTSQAHYTPGIRTVPYSQNSSGHITTAPASQNIAGAQNSLQNSSFNAASVPQTAAGVLNIHHSQNTSIVQNTPGVTTASVWSTAQYTSAVQNSPSLQSSHFQSTPRTLNTMVVPSAAPSQNTISVQTSLSNTVGNGQPQGLSQGAASLQDPVEDEDSLRKKLSVFNLTPKRAPVSSGSGTSAENAQAGNGNVGSTNEDSDSSPQLQIGAVYGAADLSNRQLAASLGLDNSEAPQSSARGNASFVQPVSQASVRPGYQYTQTRQRYPQQLPQRMHIPQSNRGVPRASYHFQRPVYPPRPRTQQWSGSGGPRSTSNFQHGTGRPRFSAASYGVDVRSNNWRQRSPALPAPGMSGRRRAARDNDDDCFEVICLDD